MRRFVLAGLLLLSALSAPVAARAQDLTVFAAASLTDVMKDVSTLWQKDGHPALRLSFGASSTLARQIEQGAPANVFASADTKWMNYLVERHLIADGTSRNLLGNQLVLVVPAGNPVKADIGPGFDLAGLLGKNGRIATGDPAHVPVGLYAEQALRKLGLWDVAAPRLARTDDVRSALLLVERGEAPAGIVYATDAAVSAKVRVAGVFPADSHDPIVYPFAVVKSGDTAGARALLDFLQGPAALAIFTRRGFKVDEH